MEIRIEMASPISCKVWIDDEEITGVTKNTHRNPRPPTYAECFGKETMEFLPPSLFERFVGIFK